MWDIEMKRDGSRERDIRSEKVIEHGEEPNHLYMNISK